MNKTEEKVWQTIFEIMVGLGMVLILILLILSAWAYSSWLGLGVMLIVLGLLGQMLNFMNKKEGK